MSTPAIAASGFLIRPVRPTDAAAIARIYNHYVLNTTVTFEEDPVPTEAMANRIAEIDSAPLPWLVAEVKGAVAGYAYANRWKARSAYRNSLETTVYLEHGFEGKGLGTMLYAKLLSRIRESGHHTAIGGTALPNEASIALHRKLGFEYAGIFRQVGFKQGRWVDVAYWQILLSSEGKGNAVCL